MNSSLPSNALLEVSEPAVVVESALELDVFVVVDAALELLASVSAVVSLEATVVVFGAVEVAVELVATVLTLVCCVLVSVVVCVVVVAALEATLVDVAECAVELLSSAELGVAEELTVLDVCASVLVPSSTCPQALMSESGSIQRALENRMFDE